MRGARRPTESPLRTRKQFALAAATAAASMFAATPVRADGPTVLRMALPNAPTHPTTVAMQKFAALVAERTKGTIEIQIFPNGTLAKERDSILGLQNGTVDLTSHTTPYLGTVMPPIQVLDLPFLFSNKESAERTLDGEIGRRLSNELATHGILNLAWGTAGWRQLEFAEKTVVKPEDIRGLRIRTADGPINTAMMKALGGLPVFIDVSEMYVAVQQHTIDGFDLPVTTVLIQKFYMVAGHISLTNHLYNPGTLLVGKRRFESLTRDQQRAITSSANDFKADWRGSFTSAQTAAIAELKTHGASIVEVDYAAFRRSMSPVYDDARQRFGRELVDSVIRESTRA